jgi:hypothetical protein
MRFKSFLGYFFKVIFCIGRNRNYKQDKMAWKNGQSGAGTEFIE